MKKLAVVLTLAVLRLLKAPVIGLFGLLVAARHRLFRLAGARLPLAVVQGMKRLIPMALTLKGASVIATTAVVGAVAVAGVSAVVAARSGAGVGALSVVSGGTMTGTMVVNEDAAMTLSPAVSVDSTVSGAVDMRVGVPVDRIIPGGQQTFGISEEGAVYAWGYSGSGQLGLGGTGSYFVPRQVQPGSVWETVTAGVAHSGFLKADGSLFMSGFNAYGQLGDGTTTQRNAPVPSSAGATYTAVSVGSEHSIGIRGDGSMWAWGNNTLGQLGQGHNVGSSATPVRIGTANDWADVDAGMWYTIARKKDGSIWGWGYNGSGNLGVGDTTNRYVPTQITPGFTYRLVRAAANAQRGMAIRTDGSLWVWGSQAVGDGTSTQRNTPVQVMAGTTFTEVAGEAGHVLAVSSDGSLWSWGIDQYGELGAGTRDFTRLAPAKVGTEVGWSGIAAGTWSSFARREGVLYSWGDMQVTALGDAFFRAVPTTLTAAWGAYSAKVPWTMGSADSSHTVWASYRDAGGTIVTVSDTIDADFTAPQGTVTLNGGTPFSRSTTLTVTSSVTGAADMRVSAGAWEPYVDVVQKTITAGDGVRSLMMEYRDVYGRITSIEDTITLDASAPVATVTVNGGAASTRFPNVSATLASVDAVAMIPQGRPGFTKVVTNGYATLGLRTDGSMWGAGGGGSGVLGDGATLNRPGFVRSAQIGQTWKDVALGGQAAVAVANDGTLWSWGYNSYGLGDGKTQRSTPVRIDAATDWKYVWGYSGTFAAMKTSGALYMWGDNYYGQLGDNSTTTRPTPTRVGAATDYFKDVALSINTHAIRLDGTLWAWGYNGDGALGIGNLTTPQRVPVKVGVDTNWSDVTNGSYNGAAIKTDGSLWTWGRNYYGSLGDGSPSAGRTSPARVGSANDWTSLTSYFGSILARKSSGTIWGWGWNYYGTVGDGSVVNRATPGQIGYDSDWTFVSSGSATSLGIKSDGSLWAWGSNSAAGQFADGTVSTSHVVPVRSDFEPFSASKTVSIAAPDGTKNVGFLFRDAAGNVGTATDSIVLDTSGSAGSVTLNGGATVSTSANVTLTSAVPWATGQRIVAPAQSVTSGQNNTMWVGADGVIYGTGSYSNGAFGTGSGGFDTVPKAVYGSRGWTSVSSGYNHTLALKGSQLFAAGGNSNAQLGDSTVTDRYAPIALAGSWQKVFAGNYSSFGIQTDGTLWAWGQNSSGRLGLGDSSTRYTPTKVGTATWRSVHSTYSTTVGIRTDGSLWTWGNNNYGQLGLGDTTARTSPTRVGTATDWVAAAAGSEHVVALKADGSLWGWGRNNVGQVGIGDWTASYSTPQLIGIGFGEIAAGQNHAVARKSDGTLWTWGEGTVGQLGLGDTAGRRSPTQVGTSSDWLSVDAEASNTSAIMVDGTVWAAGAGGSGQLGQSNSANQWSFVMMPAAWSAYSASNAYVVPYADGPVRVYGTYRDVAGNTLSFYDDITIDTKPPVTVASGVPAGWSTSSPVTVGLTATDDYSAVSGIRFSINGSAAATYTAPLSFTTQGLTTLTYSAVDALGHVETTKTASIRIDTVLPVTTTNASSGWTNDPSVVLTGSDATSGRFGTYYRLDGSAVTTYTSPLSLADGVHDLEYWTVDVAGNAEVHRTLQPRIDRVLPTSWSSAIPGEWVASDLPVTLDATDALSGVAGIRFRIDGSVPATYTGELTIGNGAHLLEWWAVDAAGNAEAATTETVRVDTAVPLTSTSIDGAWHGAPVNVSFSATDTGGCGVANTFQQVGESVATTYLAPFSISAEGTTPVSYWSVDALGNLEAISTALVRLDYTAPSTVASGVPTGVSNRAAAISLSSSDGGSGVAHTYYRINGGERRPYVADQTAVVVALEGTSTVEWWSVDGVGNTETVKSAVVRIEYASSGGGSIEGAKNGDCLQCHGTVGATSRVMNFAAPSVDRAQACPSCHAASLARTHPYHNAGGNCAACHIGWGPSSWAETPRVNTPYGAFATAASKDTDSFTLHVIHSQVRWPSTVSKLSSKCASCHAVAACTACHTGSVASGHAQHGATGDADYPAREPVTIRVAHGVPAGDQTVDSATTETSQCGTAECHDTLGVPASAPLLREDFSHVAGLGGMPANTVVKTGTWTTSYGSQYTLGRRSLSNAVNASIGVQFTGTQVAVLGDVGPNRGIMRILIDGVTIASVDTYALVAQTQVLVFKSAILPRGTHTIAVISTGTRTPGSLGAHVSVDQFRVWDDPATSVAPLCSDSCHADRLTPHGYAEVDHVADVGASIEPISGASCSSCHSMDLLTEHERLGSSPKGRMCATCHADPRNSFGSWNQTCQQAACHTSGTSQEAHAGLPKAHDASSATANSCSRNCHGRSLPVEHAKSAGVRTAVTCVECHNSTEYSAAARSVAWNETCTACHTATHGEASAEAMCLECHGASPAPIEGVGGAGAYADTAGDHSVGYSASAHGSRVVAGNNGGIETSASCEACHNHAAASDGESGQLRVAGDRRSGEQLCFACHSASGEETRTPVPNTWNGRDIAEEFGRESAHPLASIDASSATRETTVAAMLQTSVDDFVTDTRFRVSVAATTGAALTWESYTNPAELRHLLFMAPQTSSAAPRSFSQFDGTLNRWNRWGYNPPDPAAPTAYWGESGVSVANTFVWSAGSGSAMRQRYTPGVGGDPTGSWAAISDLPFAADYHVGATVDESRGVVYYTGNNAGNTVYPWRAADDTWLTPFSTVKTGGQPIDGSNSDLAYSPQTDRLYIVQKNWNSPARLYWTASPSTATTPATFTDAGLSIDGNWGGSSLGTALVRFQRSGQDFLLAHVESIGSYNYARAYVIGGLASGNHQAAALPEFPYWSNNGDPKLAWDGGDYLYSVEANWPPTVSRIRIPDDPMTGTWGAWEIVAGAPVTGSEQFGGAIGFLDVTTADEPITGYRSAGTVSTDVDLPEGASAWGKLDWSEHQPFGTTLSVRVEGWNGGVWETLPGMGSVASGPVDLSAVSPTTYRKLRLTAMLGTVEYASTPSLRAWSVSAVSSADVNGETAALACASCHNPHTVETGGSAAWDTARVSDPLNTKDPAPSSFTDFCLRCHSVGTVGQAFAADSLRPYDIGFRAFGASSFFPGWEKDGGLASFKNSAHYTTSGTKAQCETCHDPHGSDNARLTAWTKPSTFAGGAEGTRDNTSSAGFEENLCFQCHGNGSVGRQAPGAQDIATPGSLTFAHDASVSGAHSDTETAADAGTARHAECTDCHDPHAARSAGESIGGYDVASPALLGATGLKPIWNGTPWTSQSGSEATRLLGRRGDVEAYVCFKCHTAASGRPTTATSGDGSTYTATDLSVEFNPANASFHNVLGLPFGSKTLFNVGGTNYSWSLPADAEWLKPGWTSNSAVACSDCHTGGDAGAARGPHGATAKYLIDPSYPTNWRAAMLDFREPSGVYPSGVICTKCHVFNKTTNRPHSINGMLASNKPIHTREYDDRIRCVSCHITIPHGWKRPRLIGYNTDPAPYTPINTGNRGTMRAIRLESRTPNSWWMDDCYGCGIYAHPALSPAWP